MLKGMGVAKARTAKNPTQKTEAQTKQPWAVKLAQRENAKSLCWLVLGRRNMKMEHPTEGMPRMAHSAAGQRLFVAAGCAQFGTAHTAAVRRAEHFPLTATRPPHSSQANGPIIGCRLATLARRMAGGREATAGSPQNGTRRTHGDKNGANATKNGLAGESFWGHKMEKSVAK